MPSSPLTVGSGEHRVIALHGCFGSAQGWGPLPDYLDKLTFSYAFPDLRGYGSRRDVAGDFTMPEAAADALALAGELGWDQFSLVGHSMSGQAGHGGVPWPGMTMEWRCPAGVSWLNVG